MPEAAYAEHQSPGGIIDEIHGTLILVLASDARGIRSLVPNKTVRVLTADSELWTQWTERT